MSIFRGSGSHGQSNMSQIESDLMVMFHKAYSNGTLKEKPLTDCQLPIGNTSWSPHVISTPDFTFTNSRIAVYIDGHPHRSRVRTRRDNEITYYLRDGGWTVLRFSYKTNTKWKQREIFNKVVTAVNHKITETIGK